MGTLLGSQIPGLELFRAGDARGLLHVRDGQVRQIMTAEDLGALLIDVMDIVKINYSDKPSERLTSTDLRELLHTETFLGCFRRLPKVVRTPVILSDYSTSVPGHNEPDGVLYLGPPVPSVKGTDAIRRFLDVMEWDCEASATNAVAGMLTIPWRRHWPGNKPFFAVTGTKSHAGKGTVCEFILIDQTAMAAIDWDPHKDWPMNNEFVNQYQRDPSIGVLFFDNVRRRGQGEIKSSWLESLITSSQVVIGRATGPNDTRVVPNEFVPLLNTNEGSFGADMSNRHVPIGLHPKGDVTQRKSSIGNPKHEYLPANRT
jgi:hypothetical protein